MRTEIKVNYKHNDCEFTMTISDILTDEEYKTAKNTLRREMKYFIADMTEKMPIKEPEQPKGNDNVSAHRVTPTDKQISTLKRHNIFSYDGIPVEKLDKDVASRLIKDIFDKKNIQPVYNSQTFTNPLPEYNKEPEDSDDFYNL